MEHKRLTKEEMLELLATSVEDWNNWRKNKGKYPIDLSGDRTFELMLPGASLVGANLSSANLSRVDMFEVDLSNAMLMGADLTEARLFQVNLSNANLMMARLNGASLVAANLTNAYLFAADLSDTFLGGTPQDPHLGANLTDANLTRANISGANLTGTNFTRTRLYGARYSADKLKNRVAGCASEQIRGNPFLKRDIADQEYIDAIEAEFSKTSWGRCKFYLWGAIDFGRSLSKVALGSLCLALYFGSFYSIARTMDLGILDYSARASSFLTPFYYSVVTYTTLGFGDITPANWFGEVLVVGEVICGYVSLGLLLAVLANKVARRS